MWPKTIYLMISIYLIYDKNKKQFGMFGWYHAHHSDLHDMYTQNMTHLIQLINTWHSHSFVSRFYSWFAIMSRISYTLRIYCLQWFILSWSEKRHSCTKLMAGSSSANFDLSDDYAHNNGNHPAVPPLINCLTFITICLGWS